ncbi:LptF/LptG family permease [Candidatus Acetothermia bacterium]|nr:LptF/LptG family permease [Candidatus Acetothermia bacterium]MBI3643178.1 LptF/LptG family permease [Candidatus Acetothermia bacterium]
MLKLLDRYLLREMLFPFILGTFGFLIFILLLILGNLSKYLLNGFLSPYEILLFLVYQIPFFLVWAFPIALLFAILLALGRLGHDREIIALQSGGISLRRLIVPLLIAGLLLSFIDLWLSDQVSPWGYRQSNQLIDNLLNSAGSKPKIRDNAFFKGTDGRFFYIEHYDQQSNTLENVLIFDQVTSIQAGANNRVYPTIITASQASWNGEDWILLNGKVQQMDNSGRVVNADKYEQMTIHVGIELASFALAQRTSYEMSLRELKQLIDTNTKSGLAVQSLLVDYQLKIAIPAMCLVFALFGAPLGLLIGPRGRALGIILCVLLVLVYQGLLFWTATILGYRGDLSPFLGAWLPNLMFGLIGLLLFWKANQFGRVDITNRIRRALPLSIALLIMTASALSAFAQDEEKKIPIDLTADQITFSKDLNAFTARGHVKAKYSDGSVEADELSLHQVSDQEWKIDASQASFTSEQLSGSAIQIEVDLLDQNKIILPKQVLLTQSASLKFSGGNLRADHLTLKQADEKTWMTNAEGNVILTVKEQNMKTTAVSMTLKLQGDVKNPKSWVAKEAEVKNFAGESDFKNSLSETQRLRYEAEEAKLSFGDKNKLTLLDLTNGRFTTCTCEKTISDADYSIRAGHLLIRPDEVLVAFSITVSLLGQPAFWAPAFIAPLSNLSQKYPFFPEVGQSFDRGYYAKWRLPFFVDEHNFGYALLDFYSKYSEVGTGIDLSYQFLPGSRGGRLSFMRLVGQGESISLDWQDSILLSQSIALDLSTSFRSGLLAQAMARLLSVAKLSGSEGDWNWQLGFQHDQNLLGPSPKQEDLDKARYLSLDRLPEFMLTKRSAAIANLPFQYYTQFQWGHYHEQSVKGDLQDDSKAQGEIDLDLNPLELLPGVRLQGGSGYSIAAYEGNRREDWSLSPQITLLPKSGMDITLGYVLREVRGHSPFQFDQVDRAEQLSLQGSLSLTEAGALQWKMGYDRLQNIFSPLAIDFSYGVKSFQSQVEAQYDLNGKGWQTASFVAALSNTLGKFTLQGAYDAQANAFGDWIAKFDFGTLLRAALRFDLDPLQLKRINLQSVLQMDHWEVDLNSEYDFRQNQITALRFGLIKKFCHDCWQIGIYGDGKQISFQVRINAFPTAEIGYSPTDQSLSFGR